MTHQPDDEDLQRLFADLRERDRRAAPAFGAVLSSAMARGARHRRRAPVRVAVAAILVLAAVTASAVMLVRPKPPSAQVIMVGSWQSPTASLLRAPGDEILRTVPSVSYSIVRLQAETPPINQ